MLSKEIDDLLPALADKFIQDYASYAKRMSYSPLGYAISFEMGRKFIRIVYSDGGAHRSTNGFIQIVDDKKFKAGTLLKAEGWKKPALNYSRGSIFDLDNARIQWTGIY